MPRLPGLRLCVTVVALVCTGSVLAAEPPLGRWQHAAGREHPLVGKVWDVENSRWIGSRELLRALESIQYILLGEKHDNADHHRLQAWLVTSLASTRRRLAVAFEMLEVDDQSVIDRQLTRAPTDAAGLAAAVRWNEQGWPDWSLYEPIFAAALAQRLPIVATNLSRTTTRALVQQGNAALSLELVRDYGLDRPLGGELHQRLSEELKASHCGHASPETIEKMIRVQRARDAQIAQRLTNVRAEDGVVLMAGAFHVRKDEGVPVQLLKTRGDVGVVSVAFIEVSDDTIDPSAYRARFGSHQVPFDYVWFTPRVDDDDPCEKFAEQLERMKQR